MLASKASRCWARRANSLAEGPSPPPITEKISAYSPSTRCPGSFRRPAEVQAVEQAVTHQVEVGPRPGDISKALLYTECAGDEALAALAPADAAVWYIKALELLDAHGVDDDRTRWRLLIGVGQSQRLAGIIGHLEPLRAAGVLARKLGDIDLLVAALREGSFQSVEPADPERLDEHGSAEAESERLVLVRTVTRLVEEASTRASAPASAARSSATSTST